MSMNCIWQKGAPGSSHERLRFVLVPISATDWSDRHLSHPLRLISRGLETMDDLGRFKNLQILWLNGNKVWCIESGVPSVFADIGGGGWGPMRETKAVDRVHGTALAYPCCVSCPRSRVCGPNQIFSSYNFTSFAGWRALHPTSS